MLKDLRCNCCGGALKKEGDLFVCPSCGKRYKEDSLAEHIKTISDIFGEALAYQKEEQIANIRCNLWQAIREQYIDSAKIIEYCRELKKILPDDFQANFYETANSGNIQSLNKALDEIDTDKYEIYIPDIIEFMIKSLNSENLLAVNNLIERAYKQKDLPTYDQYTTKFAEEAKKVDNAVYDVTVPRDVFVAYSSVDMAKVSELVEFLEEEGLTCFVAMRNLQHGEDAVGNYEKHLQEAMDNCRTVVLVSSVASRTRSDARKVELPYIKKKDIERAPAEYGNNYKKMPAKYKKPRVEYLLEDHKGMAAESFVEEFFAGLEYRYTPREVAKAIFDILSTPAEEEKEEQKAEQKAPIKEERISQTPIKDRLEVIGMSCKTCGMQFGIEDEYNGEVTCPMCLNRYSLYDLIQEKQDNKVIEQRQKMFEEQQQRLQEEQRKMLEEQRKMLENMRSATPQRNGVNIDSLLLRAKQFVEDGDFVEAKKYYNRILDVKPDISDAWFGLFLVDNEANNPDKIFANLNVNKINLINESRKYKNAVKYANDKSEVKKYALLCDNYIKEQQRLKEEAERRAREEERIAREEAERRTREEAERRAREEEARIARIEAERRAIEEEKQFKLLSSVAVIKNGVLKKYKGKEANLVIPSAIKAIDDEAFKGLLGGNKYVENVVIGNGVIRIGTAFRECQNLKSIKIGNSVEVIDNYAFDGCSALEGDLIIPESVKKIGCAAFRGCKNLKKFMLGRPVEIGDYAFDGCSALEGDLIISEDVKKIGRAAFRGCKNLKKFMLGKPVEIGDYAFDGCSALEGDLIIPNSIKKIGLAIFRGCQNLKNLMLGRSVEIGDSAFDGCSSLEGDLIIPNSIKKIGSAAFSGCKNLKNIKFGKSVEVIGDSAFKECSALEGDLIIPDNINIIGPAAFSGCKNLKSVMICNPVEVIMDSTFSECKSLKRVILGSSIKVNKKSTSKECKNEESITFGSSVKVIGDYAFDGCSALEGNLTIPDSITSIRIGAFSGCNFSSFTIGNGITTISSCAFAGNNFQSVIIPNHIKTIGEYAFASNNVHELTIGSGVTFIGAWAFAGNKLKNLIIPRNVETIGVAAFERKTFEQSFPMNVTIPNKFEKNMAEIFGYVVNTYNVIYDKL